MILGGGVTKTIDLCTFHCGWFLKAWSVTWLSYISFHLASWSQTVLIAASSNSSLLCLLNYHPGCEVSVISQWKRIGTEILCNFYKFFAQIAHLNHLNPSHKLDIWPNHTHHLTLFWNINCLQTLPWSFLTILISHHCSNCVIKQFASLPFELWTFWKLRAWLIYFHNPITTHNAKSRC